MTFYTNSPNEQTILAAVQSWIMTALPLSIGQVILASDNRVPQPLDPLIVLSHLSRTPCSTPWITYNDTGVQGTEAQITNMSVEYKLQLDIYGANSADYAMVLHVLLRSDATSEWFTNYGTTNGLTVDTFYAEDPTRTAITNEENQYEERWTLRFKLNIVEAISTPVNFMGSATVGHTNVSTLPR